MDELGWERGLVLFGADDLAGLRRLFDRSISTVEPAPVRVPVSAGDGRKGGRGE
jgi:hypothetical protein